jgi:hypothetical protein
MKFYYLNWIAVTSSSETSKVRIIILINIRNLIFIMITTMVILSGNIAIAQIIWQREAENSVIVSARPGDKTNSSLLASGQFYTTNWGSLKEDSISCIWLLHSPVKYGQVALRYAYDDADMTRREGPQDTTRNLILYIDGTTTRILHVPDTHGWADFETAYCELPDLAPGRHTLELKPASVKVITNVDCITIFTGIADHVLSLPFRQTVVARQKYPAIWVKMSPYCQVVWSPEQILKEFNKIYFWFKDWTGWEPDRQLINILIYEHALGQGAYENSEGVNFDSANFNWDKGNWCHEMNHVWHNGYFPPFIEHALIRTNDAFDSIDGIFPDRIRPPGETLESHTQDCRKIANKILKNPNYWTDDFQEVMFALRVKFGPKLTTRFYHELLAAGKRGEIPLKRGGPLYKMHMVKYMSRAAGEDVTPYFAQWTGWAKEE